MGQIIEIDKKQGKKKLLSPMYGANFTINLPLLIENLLSPMYGANGLIWGIYGGSTLLSPMYGANIL